MAYGNGITPIVEPLLPLVIGRPARIPAGIPADDRCIGSGSKCDTVRHWAPFCVPLRVFESSSVRSSQISGSRLRRGSSRLGYEALTAKKRSLSSGAEVPSRQADVGEQAIIDIAQRAHGSSRGRPAAPQRKHCGDPTKGEAQGGSCRAPRPTANGGRIGFHLHARHDGFKISQAMGCWRAWSGAAFMTRRRHSEATT